MSTRAPYRAGAVAASAIAIFLAASRSATPATPASGQDFWLLFEEGFDAVTSLEVTVASQVATTGTVEIPGLGFSTGFSVPAGGVAVIPLPLAAMITAADVTESKGVHVTAQDDVTVLGASQGVGNNEAFLALPVPALGLDYFALAYGNDAGIPRDTQFAIVATQDGTLVDITPSVVAGPHPPGVTFTITLNQGETYQLRANGAADLTGSVFSASQPIAISAGHQCGRVPVGFAYCSTLRELMPPTSDWGTRFFSVPLALRVGGDVLRFLAMTDATQVTIPGVTSFTINQGQVVQLLLTAPAEILASNPILVGQYATSYTFDNLPVPPSGSAMQMLIPPVEQHAYRYALMGGPLLDPAARFANVVAPAAAVGAILLDGTAIPAGSFQPIGSSGYSGAAVPVTPGPHLLEGPLPFGAVTYGFGGDANGGVGSVAYGYPAAGLPVQADLSVSKTDGQASAVPGQPVTYTIVATNLGPDGVSGATVTDTLPAALLSASWTCTASPGSTCTASGNGSIADTVDLLASGTASYTLTATIDPAATGTLDNAASVAAPAGVPDPNPGNNSASDSDTLTPESDLTLGDQDSPDPVEAGGTLTYVLGVFNIGPSASSGATLSDTLPPEVTFVSSTPGAPTCTEAGGTVTCNLPGQGANALQEVTLVVTVNPGTLGTINNAATVTGNEPDPDPANNVATETTQVVLGFESELVHGSALWADLQPAGVVPDEDLYRIAQQAYSSYEVVVDGTSGDIGVGQGPELDRVSSDGSTVLQSSVAAGAGSSRSLHWENDTAGMVSDEYVRVRSAGCTTTCGPEDVYRIRAFDTTMLVPRFNNSATQITILVLQNPSDATVAGHAHFWSNTGALLGTQAFGMNARAAFVVNTTTVPGVVGGGTITLSHDGPYGVLVGKAVALETATGFTFDTALEPRRR